MITQGMAWWYRAYAREQSLQERGQYEFAELEAKARKVGLWRDAEPIAPWDWRKASRELRQSPSP
jgi:endonuclease YncB( thermonuclease family)